MKKLLKGRVNKFCTYNRHLYGTDHDFEHWKK